MFVPKSASDDVIWPAIPRPADAFLLSVLFQIEQSQWWRPEQLRNHQFRQIGRILQYASQHVPYYRQRFHETKITSGDFSSPEAVWQRIPVVSRREVQIAGTDMHSTELGERHGKFGHTVTSGSTGQPILAVSTEVTRKFWSVLTLRDHLWHRRDFSLSLAAIRDTHVADACPPHGKYVADWGAPSQGLIDTGPAYLLSAQATIDEQIQWIKQVQPAYLLAYPSALLAIAKSFGTAGSPLEGLRQLRTFGEIVEPDMRAFCEEAFRAPLVDMYSAQEVGYIALQCPDQKCYHVQSENLLVEILTDDGRPCAPGEVGHVVVTTLHNFAMPLIRYDLGDYAEVGDTCPCGRGLPTLKRILGRQRNVAHLPDGKLRWPSFSQGVGLEQLPKLYQFQVIQRTPNEIEALYVSPQALSISEQEQVKDYLADTLGHRFHCILTRVEAIARSPSGKFEEFRCEVGVPRRGDPG